MRKSVIVATLDCGRASVNNRHNMIMLLLQVTYDVLVLATGSNYSAGSRASILKSSQEANSVDQRVEELRKAAADAKEANIVVVVGAGLSGIEVAAEIAVANPSVEVKLVSSHAELGEGFNPKVAVQVRKVFQ